MTAASEIDDPLQESDKASTDQADPQKKPRRRRTRPFPALSFLEALPLAIAIQEHGAGQRTRRLTLFEALGRSPDSGTTRRLITASVQYGITTGGYSAEFLELTPAGAIASNPTSPERVQKKAQLELAIESIAPFKHIYEKYRGSRLPTSEVLRDAAVDSGVDNEFVSDCVETFLANCRELGLIRNIGGSEHLVSIDTVLDQSAIEGPDESPKDLTAIAGGIERLVTTQAASIRIGSSATETSNLEKVCFIISPIGSADSEERKHADLMLGSLIEPALAKLGLTAVRADHISKPGLITGQVMDHVSRAALVIADLSFSNPNVYYELALRHATRRPAVQIIRSSDRLPFDVGQYRTVHIDMADIYTLVPQIDLHRQEITRQCRAALEEGGGTESPLSQFYPAFWDQIAIPAAPRR